jgi:hypothetical protein
VDVGQRFSRQPGRIEACGDNDDGVARQGHRKFRSVTLNNIAAAILSYYRDDTHCARDCFPERGGLYRLTGSGVVDFCTVTFFIGRSIAKFRRCRGEWGY